MYLWMMKQMFGNNSSDIIPDLQNVTLASKKGYWMLKFLFHNLLEAGAKDKGVVKKVSFFQFLLW